MKAVRSTISGIFEYHRPIITTLVHRNDPRNHWGQGLCPFSLELLQWEISTAHFVWKWIYRVKPVKLVLSCVTWLCLTRLYCLLITFCSSVCRILSKSLSVVNLLTILWKLWPAHQVWLAIYFNWVGYYNHWCVWKCIKIKVSFEYH